MKKLIGVVILIALSCSLLAQVPQGRILNTTQTPLPPPLPLRQVSGIVKDEKDQPVIGAAIILKSKSDTISTATDADGIFVFKDVKQATFNITVQTIGYSVFVKKYLNNDLAKKIVLDQIILTTKTNELNEVKISGKPSIVYKTDTIEYKASDYKVREYATLDELLKKMEGFEVGSDGSVTHQGQQITRARLNGKDFAGGGVAQAVQNLPADIIENVQVIDDYGDQAARTGIKDGDPKKVLNVTTKADRSIGTTARLTGQYGNNDRYNAQLFALHIDANQQLTAIGQFANTVTGVASTGVQGGAANGGGGGGAGGGSPGTARSGAPSFGYNDQWGKKIQVVSSYTYRYSDNNSINNSYGQRYSSIGPSDFVRQSTRENDSKSQTISFRMEYNMDKLNYLIVTPSISYATSTSTSNALTDNLNYYTTGFEHPVDKSTTTNTTTTPTYGMTAFYQHIFKKPKRNMSLQLGITNTDSRITGDKTSDYRYYADTTHNTLLSDSTAHLLIKRTDNNTTYNGSLTYSEPISQYSLLQFGVQTRRADYNTRATQDTVLANGQVEELTRLDNIYNYSFTESRIRLSYQYNGDKFNFSIGAAAVPYVLSGTKEDNNTGLNTSTSRSDFRVIPVLNFSYSWSTIQRLSVSYSGANTEPGFQEIQPFTDRSDPNNIIVGNPNLKPTFTNSYNVSYNNYFQNSRFNISLDANGTFFNNQVTTNTLNLLVPNGISPITHLPQNKTINEINYVNINGSHAIVGRYSISKQFDGRNYNLELNGNMSYNYTNAMSNDTLYHATNWRFDERFGPRISPNENIEINPYIGYDVSRSFATTRNASSTSLQTTSLALDGKVYFEKTFMVSYSASKNYVTGLKNFNTNPLVINAGFEKRFLQRKNLVLTFNINDILHQNNFIQQTVNAQGVTNTQSNTLSRYFLIGLILNLQHWGGTPMRGGQILQRRGDGSFIY